MSTAFSFFLRLFLCFAGAKFLLQAVGWEGRGYLVGLTLLFLANVYLFSYLVFKDRTASPAPKSEGTGRPPAEVSSGVEVNSEKPLPPEG
jgi:hypothetical protein